MSTEVSCTFDQCHSFVAKSRRNTYCVACNCARKAEVVRKRVHEEQRNITCAFDACHTFSVGHDVSRIKYCKECGCKNKADLARKTRITSDVTCAFDRCHTFPRPKGAANTRYCRDCGCALRAKARHKQELEVELFEQPQEYKVLQIKKMNEGSGVFIINDLQMPFHDQRVLSAIERFWDDFEPQVEIYNGDIFDFYLLSEYNKNPSRAFSLQDELDIARGWLKKRAERNPSARRIFGDGNHEDRLRRWLWRHGPDLASLRALKVEELLSLEDSGFEHLNYRSVVDLLGFRIEHGYRSAKSAAFPSNVARLMAIATGSSGLVGHTHRISVYHFSDSRGSHSFHENGCVCLLDLEYAPFPNWQHGFSYGRVFNNKLHLVTVPVYPDGFVAEGVFYKVSS